MLYTTQQALEILQEHGITSSRQQVTKWIRQGKLNAIPFEKNKPQIGYRIEEKELDKFIEDRRTTRFDMYERIRLLEEENDTLRQQLAELTKPKKRGRPPGLKSKKNDNVQKGH
ncbi:helix-turn-helix domain-containing protein [Alicyclobacillus sp. SO9]|uniref:helix-turn-helix domain-containing protein n=1 Tax=Alicyclobacillus sp. SO9 TaxID=2665646 RepID=UPI0018E8603B|nr:helix-turn-helix domain-containing protein [Alicyclobacillus sp. SO9]QQE77765.1 helix-turn-helix domain-containing protein [Alicyclobacillus sp. SO9]